MLHKQPRIKQMFSVTCVPDDAVYLLSERGHFVLKGDLNQQLVPLLDGRRSIPEIIERLSPAISPTEIYYGLYFLDQRGYLCDAHDELSEHELAFWQHIQSDGAAASTRASFASVSVCSVDLSQEEVAAEVTRSLADSGVAIVEEGDCAIVVVDDYLNPALQRLAAGFMSQGRTWMPFKPQGTTAWWGPIMQPSSKPCWSCIAKRIEHNRRVENHVGAAGGASLVPNGWLRSTLRLGSHALALELLRFFATGPDFTGDEAASITTFDHLAMRPTRHRPIPIAECGQCNKVAPTMSDVPKSIAIESRAKAYVDDGGHRTVRPGETLNRIRRHVSPVAGIISGLANLTEESTFLHVFGAMHDSAFASRGLNALQSRLRYRSSGKGVTVTQAEASALCEAIERTSGVFRGSEPRLRASFDELPNALKPNDVMLFSESQYRDRQTWNEKGDRTQLVPERFDERSPIEWCALWSLTERRHKYVPASLCYYGAREPQGITFTTSCSNGCASGNNLEEAIFQGLMELVERDAVAIWWYNRMSRTAVDLDEVLNSQGRTLLHQLGAAGVTVWALDITTDLAIPACAVVATAGPSRGDSQGDRIMFGFGAHLDRRIAASRALTELVQYYVLSEYFDKYDDVEDNVAKRWWDTASLKDHSYLSPKQGSTSGFQYERETADIKLDIEKVVSILKSQGMEALVLDQTRGETGIHVARTVAPGLRHFWPRYAPGRLFDVPRKLEPGFRTLCEAELNPIPMFL